MVFAPLNDTNFFSARSHFQRFCFSFYKNKRSYVLIFLFAVNLTFNIFENIPNSCKLVHLSVKTDSKTVLLDSQPFCM